MKNINWLAGAFAILIAIANPLVAEVPRVFTVDNNGGPHADFTDLQEAVDAAEDGDIFHVLGSPISYGDATITRQVHLFGPGYNQARVYTEGYQSFHEATLGSVTISPTPTTTPAGTSISGFKATAISIGAADVTIERNWVTGQIWTTAFRSNNIWLEQPHRARIIRNIIGAITMQSESSNSVNHLISNNIITLSGGGGIIIRNATFRHNYGSNIYAPTFSHCIVENNIFGTPSTSSTNNLIRHNFFAANEPNTSFYHNFFSQNTLSDNTWGLAAGVVNQFELLTTNTGAFDERYQLAEDSLAKGAGIDGADLGPYAGPFPYEISGVPPLPRVKIMAPGPFVASPNSDLDIPVKIILE